ncbi:MAG TPA: 16S rRNA (cytosine(1402)-N(4))-methyltransferase RsmH [Verrucomicrobiota bacterium]|nr:16S rRNA (cytosine(1402)-N(4))-methyltransferase RsmH [Verrucomicrobiota bacterium]
MTEFIHEPVLLEEVLLALQPAEGRFYVDCTVGGGGHAEAILKASCPGGRLVAFDRDDRAIAAAAGRLVRFGDRLELHREPFSGLTKYLAEASCDGVLLDLGVSSPQLDEPERGFSFQTEGPLDMRMDRRQPVTAEQLVNELEAGELARIIWELGGERRSRRITQAIVERRDMERFETTTQLADTVERVCPRRGARTHPATGVFQALRMAVNDELGQAQMGLEAAWSVLKPGGRLAVITFHSGEDRLVKQFSRRLARAYTVRGEVDVPELREPHEPLGRELSRKPVKPSASELERNPRSRSAKLRALEKT